jgi:UDPglucose 6-dehydrogenase|tara:strand:- start:3964 stop:4725 length:762 start_codon:yes stop_codon:yes gene_type:complete
MRITIAGYGFVGKAMEAYLQQTSNQIAVIDPKISSKKISTTEPNGVIVCVSTPQSADGSCDMSNVIDVLSDIEPKTHVLLKSTISLEGWNKLRHKFPTHLISYSPEYIRAETANQDMLNNIDIKLGGGNFYWWERTLQRNDKLVKVSYARPEDLILAKYFRNSFLATKVAFFNQIYDLCNATGIDYEAVASLITEDNRIGDSHTRVTSERGFGGHCFPKDTQAILKTANDNNIDLTLIEQAILYNNQIRKGNT